MTEDMMRREMWMMKDMGVNFIRLGHYQQSEIILDLCDELGILVWEEIPWCRGGLGGDVYKEQARRMLPQRAQKHPLKAKPKLPPQNKRRTLLSGIPVNFPTREIYRFFSLLL